MKKVLSLLLALLMLATVFTGCGDDGKGAVIPVYISDEIINLDPAFAYDNEASLKILPLLYEGLTTINAKGKVEKALMDKYTYEEQEDGTFMMEVTLKESYWSDGITVSADDFVYAFKRILDPEFNCSASALLYDLKNARDVKRGIVSIDDLGVCSAEKSVLQFIFEKDIDEDAWLETLASPALVPLRESAVSIQEPTRYMTGMDASGNTVSLSGDVPAYAWSTDSSIILTNGKFGIKRMVLSDNEDGELILERNAYYRRDPQGGEKENKYVKTYQLKIVYPGKGTRAEYALEAGEVNVSLSQFVAYAMYNSDEKSESIVFDADIGMLDEDVKATETVDMLSQHVYYFNTNNELFKDARVRRALSMAIDREKITEIVDYTVASEGLVVEGVYADAKRKETYREKFGSLIEDADAAAAKSLLKEAGVTSGSFSIACRDSDVDVAIAEYIAEVWNSLGFTVSVKKLSMNDIELDSNSLWTNEYHLYRDELTSALIYGQHYNPTSHRYEDIDVLALDYTALSTYAFASLAPFAKGFSGRGIDLRLANSQDNYDRDPGHIFGWNNDEYNELIEKAFEESDLAKRSEILFEAEKILMEEMPVMPVVRYQNAYLCSKDLKKLDNGYYGTVYFDRAKLNNADEYVSSEEE